jgi:hypothetical protein
MNATGTRQAGAATQMSQPDLRNNNEDVGTPDSGSGRRVGYGLPCANCGTYYDADQAVCPVCKSNQRVSPTAIPSNAVHGSELPNVDDLEEERERFLKEFKSQLFSAHMQINTSTSFRCTLEQNHEGTSDAAAVCKACYDHLQQKADLMEAALHIDLKEAAQIVYDAVWADPSDPSKTYQNAASALLTEVRKRAGMDIVLTTLQPYRH